ncbi:MAG TPA: hypothetical protein VGG14_04850 [Candidatus Sulfotelmatobacter sp.]
MSRKKKQTEPESNPMVVDESEFTEVIRKMVNTTPVTRKDVEGRGLRRKKNPETDPVKLAMLFPAMSSQKRKR